MPAEPGPLDALCKVRTWQVASLWVPLWPRCLESHVAVASIAMSIALDMSYASIISWHSLSLSLSLSLSRSRSWEQGEGQMFNGSDLFSSLSTIAWEALNSWPSARGCQMETLGPPGGRHIFQIHRNSKSLISDIWTCQHHGQNVASGIF